MSAPKLKVVLQGNEVVLAPGGSAAVSVDQTYRDAPDALLAAMQEDIVQGMPWRQAAAHRLSSANPWLLRIVTDPARTRWLDLHPPRQGSWILDVGSGWGQFSVPAAAFGQVVALEPTPARLAMARAIALQERCAQRMFFVGASLEDVSFPDRRFDHVYCIGVLEWVPKFQVAADPIDAQRNFLRRMHAVLADEGECIIGIENRFGLKYLLGARDDHTGFADVSTLDAATAAHHYLSKTGQPLRVYTHTMAEYQSLLAEAGFGKVEFFAAYPDYKIPQAILSIADGTANRHCLGGSFISEHDGSDGTPLNLQHALASHYRSLAELGIAGQFAPSFFIRARR
jgi:2-polyprenyl-3-methyl-5-hydroxy-6-metoxy-1,4-benzoquinol methylase